ncbi:reverse transcriptase domain-containing protein [Tanacetum coccineum]
MAKRDEEKTAFYTEQGTYCVDTRCRRSKERMAQYQRLVDSTLPKAKIGKTWKAYVDDMVIKVRKREQVFLADIAETLKLEDNKHEALHPPKSVRSEEEGKFLSLSGKKQAFLNLFAKSAERALPFFNTLKNITKENKHEYRWTTEAEEAFQQMKRLIMSLPSLTPPFPEETLYAYLAVSREAVSAVLLTDRNGRQCPVQYVSRTLNEAERNYSPLEKLALSLVNMTRRSKRYFELHRNSSGKLMSSGNFTMRSCGMHVGPSAVERKAMRQGFIAYQCMQTQKQR